MPGTIENRELIVQTYKQGSIELIKSLQIYQSSSLVNKRNNPTAFSKIGLVQALSTGPCCR
jgi:hypothetical protein